MACANLNARTSRLSPSARSAGNATRRDAFYLERPLPVATKSFFPPGSTRSVCSFPLISEKSTPRYPTRKSFRPSFSSIRTYVYFSPSPSARHQRDAPSDAPCVVGIKIRRIEATAGRLVSPRYNFVCARLDVAHGDAPPPSTFLSFFFSFYPAHLFGGPGVGARIKGSVVFAGGFTRYRLRRRRQWRRRRRRAAMAGETSPDSFVCGL